MTQGTRQVDKILELLRGNVRTITNNEVQLLSELRTQLFEYCGNLKVDGTNSDLANHITNSISHLSQSMSTRMNNDDNIILTKPTQINTPTLGSGITTSFINGTQFYFLEGHQIKFKILKNKPKNGDFKTRWNKNFEALKEYKEKYRTTRVTRTSSGNRELGNWVAEQRRKLKKGRITQKQFEAMNDLGFEWDRSSYFYNTYKPRKE